MKFSFFRFLDHQTKTCPTFSLALHHFFCFCRHRPSWPLLKMDNILGSVDGNNTGDGRTLSCVPQESPSEISGPTIDVSMHSGKKKAPKKLKKLCRLQKSLITLRLLTWCQNACDRYHSEHN